MGRQPACPPTWFSGPVGNQVVWKASCLPLNLIQALWGTRLVRFHDDTSPTWFLRPLENQVAVQTACLICYLVQATSSSRLEVQRLAPTYQCVRVKLGESVSRSLTPASESPWHEA